jgi:hypothetical protein
LHARAAKRDTQILHPTNNGVIGGFMSMGLGRFVFGSARGSILLASLALGCQGTDSVGDDVTTVVGAISANGVTTANLQLQVAKNACASNVAQDYFKVTNATTASVPLSQISIKYWINDTSAASIVPAVWYGGCVTSANGTCVHPMTGVTATAVRFTPGCGPDANHQANWEVTISTTDTTALGPGQTWSGIQSAVNLATYASFKPGSSTWYSGCASGQPFASDTHFAVYLNGDLVTAQGAQPPSCRAPVPADGGV